MSYYDVDAILTDAQKVPCTFELTVPGLGHLEGNPGAEVKEGTKLELPLWLAQMLAITPAGTKPGMITLDLPDSLSQKVTNALRADPRTVELRSLAPHFFNLGTRMLDLFEEEELSDLLTESFKLRAKELADHAHNPRGALGEGAEFLQGLDENERRLFRATHEGAKAVRAWLVGMQKK
ncbi:DNA replication complex GINS protein-like protein psf3 [Eremomyces bilateralis CBS 781.70]|uniref:DNA replication complex GINS protein PSF3 n=1 Tax=Eremomyces bilateralis CBS 781.70 TaxID=1392243 RepID=A0A6G1G7J2_9PEZI|nr:DNA replication complex GINS protein-like protein psf3 [Eremomyces bilateralis CBS 781.70]KAF1814028.1 DNA replication complex GINS protein-like protein psf3 [Eremomyces bilateralis CBS 781.70]